MGWLDSRRGARLLLAGGLCLAAVYWTWRGSQRWFTADDWYVLMYRDLGRGDLVEQLFRTHQGHPIVPTVVQFWVTSELLGWSSYLPYALVPLALHLGSLVVLWALIRRSGVSELTSSAVVLVVAAFGRAVEFPVFAIISNYEYTLLGALLVFLIVDTRPDGDRLHLLAAVLGVVSVLSSSFGPLLAIGHGVATFGRRRWRTGLVVVVPQLVVYAVWWLVWGREWAGRDTTPSRAPEFAVVLLTRTLESLAAPLLGGVALLATAVFGVAMCGRDAGTRLVWPMTVSAVLIAVVLGVQRAVNGTADAATGRYVLVLTFLLAPAFGLAVDRLRAIGQPALLAGLVLLAGSAVVNATDWADRHALVAGATMDDRRLLELVAGSDLTGVDGDLRPSWCPPDVRVEHLPWLVERGALTPRAAVTPDEERLVAAALGDLSEGDPRPCAPGLTASSSG